MSGDSGYVLKLNDINKIQAKMIVMLEQEVARLKIIAIDLERVNKVLASQIHKGANSQKIVKEQNLQKEVKNGIKNNG